MCIRDRFTSHLCRDNNIKANLGKNVHICEQARINLQIPPWQTALKNVVAQTHLCGAITCNEYIASILETMTSSINRVLFCIFGAIMMIQLFFYIWRRLRMANAKRKLYDVNHHFLPQYRKQHDDFKVLTNINYKLD